MASILLIYHPNKLSFVEPAADLIIDNHYQCELLMISSQFSLKSKEKKKSKNRILPSSLLPVLLSTT